ncbi:MAG: hypothetical protein K6E51_07570, partial [Treponema sp.]|nr:hypothetical protein [Treponema sp.]
MKQILFCITILIFSFSLLFAQTTEGVIHIDFYGVIANDVDKSMHDITKNLYISQLQDMQNITLSDKSSSTTENLDAFQAATGTDPQTICLIAQITQVATDNWTCTLSTKRFVTGEELELVRQYNSYYKVLTDVKDSVTELLDKLHTTGIVKKGKDEQKTFTGSITPEMLAGTWQGEDYISKIVILRGGRGFVIYKNGATMNINI